MNHLKQLHILFKNVYNKRQKHHEIRMQPNGPMWHIHLSPPKIEYLVVASLGIDLEVSIHCQQWAIVRASLCVEKRSRTLVCLLKLFETIGNDSMFPLTNDMVSLLQVLRSTLSMLLIWMSSQCTRHSWAVNSFSSFSFLMPAEWQTEKETERERKKSINKQRRGTMRDGMQWGKQIKKTKEDNRPKLKDSVS